MDFQKKKMFQLSTRKFQSERGNRSAPFQDDGRSNAGGRVFWLAVYLEQCADVRSQKGVGTLIGIPLPRVLEYHIWCERTYVQDLSNLLKRADGVGKILPRCMMYVSD